MNSLRDLHYNPSGNLCRYLDKFSRTWARLAKNCATSSVPGLDSMNAVFDCGEAKGIWFLLSLEGKPTELVNTITARGIEKFDDIELIIRTRYS